MAKQGLGRDLGTLMGRKPKQDDAPALASAPSAIPPQATPPPVSAGVRSLMRGNSQPAQATAPKPAVPRWYLFAGDVLLVALALITVLKSPHPLSFPREAFCAALVILAAALAVIALLAPAGKK